MDRHDYQRQVEKFYARIWDAHDKSVIPQVLHEDFTFRGSLGDTKRGHAGFAQYLDAVHDALGGYRCMIEDLVIEPGRVFAKMRFTGTHRAPFMGYPATGQSVSWAGCALFTFTQDKVSDLWVLGDLKSLEAQLARNAMAHRDSGNSQ